MRSLWYPFCGYFVREFWSWKKKRWRIWNTFLHCERYFLAPDWPKSFVHCAKLATMKFIDFDLEISKSFNFDGTRTAKWTYLCLQVYIPTTCQMCLLSLNLYRIASPVEFRARAPLLPPWSRHGKSVKKTTTTDKRLTYSMQSQNKYKN